MESDSNEKVIDLIRKCLALSDSPNENEAAAAMAKAQELLEKYNLDISNVSVQQNIAPELFKADIEYGQNWKRVLYSGVAKQNFCAVIGIGGKTLQVLGRLPNVIATHEMAEWLSSQLERLANIETVCYSQYSLVNGKVVKGTDNKRQYRTDFLFGATHRVLSRLAELNETRRENSPGTRALVASLLTEAQSFMNIEYPRRVSHHMSVRKHSAGYGNGINAANGVSIVAPSRHIHNDGKLYLTG